MSRTRTHLRLQWLAACLVVVAGCGEQAAELEGDVGLFSRKVALDVQLARLGELGITRNAGTEESDLFIFHSRKEMEKKPYKLLAESMGYDIEREPWTPVSDRLWMCDFEYIEDDGAYRDVILRLERMTASALGLTNIEDRVDIESDVAWVQFDHGGTTVRWDLSVQDDWLDPEVLIRYDALLAESSSDLRLYMDQSGSHGQVAFLAALSPEQQKTFTKLTGIPMGIVR